MAWISCVGRYSSTNFLPCNRCHSVLFPVFRSPRMTIFTWGTNTVFIKKKISSVTFFTWVGYINKIILIIHMIVKVTCCIEPTASDIIPTVILDTLGKPSLQTLVHGLQAGRDGLLSELPRLWSYQLLKSWKHFGKVSAGPSKSRRQRAGSCGTTGTIVADREAQRSILASWGIQGPMLRGNSDAKLISTEWASFKYEYILVLAKLKQWSLCCFQDLHLSENRNGKELLR